MKDENEIRDKIDELKRLLDEAQLRVLDPAKFPTLAELAQHAQLRSCTEAQITILQWVLRRLK